MAPVKHYSKTDMVRLQQQVRAMEAELVQGPETDCARHCTVCCTKAPKRLPPHQRRGLFLAPDTVTLITMLLRPT